MSVIIALYACAMLWACSDLRLMAVVAVDDEHDFQ